MEATLRNGLAALGLPSPAAPQMLDFLIIALVLFMVVKAINKLRAIGKKPEEPAEEEAPAPTSEELLTEIRDLLKDKQ